MELQQQMESVRTKEELVNFIAVLRADLNAHMESWENPTLESFLESMAAWLAATDYLEKSRGDVGECPSWKTIANMLYAAKMYE